MLQDDIREMLCDARAYARREGMQVEFLLHREKSSLLRLGNSAVALSTSEELTRLDITVFEGRRTGAFSFTAEIVSLDQLKDAIRRAHDYCLAGPEIDYQPIFGEVEADIDDEHGYDPELEQLPADTRAALCAEVIADVKPWGDYDFSGSWSSGSTEVYAITTANDREAYRRLTDGRLMLVLKERQRKWELSAEQTGRYASDFSAAGLQSEFHALLPVYERMDGYRTELGYTRVLFGPQAIAELVGLAIWSGFLGRGWEEMRAFTCGKQFGETILSPLVTLVDDPAHPDVFGMPFDLKGKARHRFPLVENGVFRGLLYSAAAAAKYGKAPTGHDLDAGDMVLATGDGPAGRLAGLALAGEALYIPHLHYLNMPDPARGLFTGSSRFNALRVEGGAAIAPLLSSRITDTIPNVLSHVVAVASNSVSVNVSNTYGRRAPEAVSVPEYLLCDHVRVSDVADSF